MTRTALRVLRRLLTSRILLGGVLAAGAIAGLAFAFGGGSSHQVEVRFADADGLVAGNELRVAGVPAGSVQSVAIGIDRTTGAQYADTVVQIDDSHWPLHQGTTFAVRPKGVLSNVFVALNPGSRSAPTVDSSHVFGLSETSSPINLDEFSNLFDPDVRTSLRTQIQEGTIAFGGSGATNLNQTLRNLNPLTSDLSPLTAVLAQRSPELDRLNGEFDTITAELASEDSNLRGLIDNGNVFLGALVARQHQLQDVLDHASTTLASLDSGLKGEEGNLAAVFQKGPAALDKTKRAADLLVPLIDYVNPHIPDLNVLLHEFHSATGLQTACTDAAECQNGSTIDTFRANTTLNDANHATAVPCGGEPSEQGPSCPGVHPNTGTAAASGGSAAAGSSPSAGSAGATQPTPDASPSPEAPAEIFGGLFG
jgi:ABC-type transporter Mla subunit MlaD